MYNKKIITTFYCILLWFHISILLTGCGYTWQGQEKYFSKRTILGDGTKTLCMNNVEQSTLYPWLPYMIRTQVRNDINARKLAIWVDSGPSDFTLTVRINSFQIRSAGEYKQHNLLFTATVNMELIIFDGKTNTEIWNSGPVIYSENYEHANEEQAIQEVIFMTTRRAIDQIQQPF